MTLGTQFLPSPTQALESVWFYTKPANASVQFGNTYYTFLIVKHNSSVEGFCYIELGIGKTSINVYNVTSTDYNHDQWNINMMSVHNVSHGLCIAQLNITFDNITLKGISANLTDANRTLISIRYRFRIYGRNVVDPSSTMAFIDIKESSFSDMDESGSGVDDNGTHTDSSKGGNATTGSAQEHASSHMTTDNSKKLFNTVSSSFQLGVGTELLIICSLIVLSFSVV